MSNFAELTVLFLAVTFCLVGQNHSSQGKYILQLIRMIQMYPICHLIVISWCVLTYVGWCESECNSICPLVYIHDIHDINSNEKKKIKHIILGRGVNVSTHVSYCCSVLVIQDMVQIRFVISRFE